MDILTSSLFNSGHLVVSIEGGAKTLLLNH